METNSYPIIFTHHGLDKDTRVVAVYTDFSKDFDKVHNKILLVKPHNIRILLRWIESYLSNRI